MTRPTLRSVLNGDERVALVIQGGGMRGTYSIAALIPFAEAGYTARFGDVYGTSAGAMNGAYYISGQAEPGLGIYLDHLPGKRFINKRRLRRIIDIDHLVDDILKREVPLDTDALASSPTQLHVGVTSASTGNLVWFDEQPGWPLFEVLRATAALPIVFGREVQIGDDRYVDGGLNLPVPVDRAIADGYRNILVVLTRPVGYRLDSPSLALLTIMRLAGRVQRHSPAILTRLGSQGDHFNQTADLIEEAQVGHGDIHIWCIAPTAPIASRLTSDRATLLRTVEVARADGAALLRDDT